MSFAADSPRSGSTVADVPGSTWIADAPRTTVDTAPALWIPAIPSGVVANFTGSGTAVATVIAKPGLYAQFTGRGQLAATALAKVAVSALFTGAGEFAAIASLPARFKGTGTLSAVARPGATRTAAFTGSGTLSATIVPIGVTTAPFAGSGSATGAIAVPRTAAFTGSGTLAAAVIGGYPVTAGFTGSGTLAASVVPVVPVTAAFTGSGTLAIAQRTFSVAASFTGSGTFSATAVPGFNPSGMTKNGNYNPVPTSYTTVPSWTANTGTYPGSTVSSDGVVAQSAKTGATLTTRLSITNTAFGSNTITVRLLVAGVVKVTGSGNSIGSNATQNVDLTGTADVNSGDIVTVQVFAATSSPALQVNTGTGSYVTIT